MADILPTTEDSLTSGIFILPNRVRLFFPTETTSLAPVEEADVRWNGSSQLEIVQE